MDFNIIISLLLVALPAVPCEDGKCFAISALNNDRLTHQTKSQEPPGSNPGLSNMRPGGPMRPAS